MLFCKIFSFFTFISISLAFFQIKCFTFTYIHWIPLTYIPGVFRDGANSLFIWSCNCFGSFSYSIFSYGKNPFFYLPFCVLKIWICKKKTKYWTYKQLKLCWSWTCNLHSMTWHSQRIVKFLTNLKKGCENIAKKCLKWGKTPRIGKLGF